MKICLPLTRICASLIVTTSISGCTALLHNPNAYKTRYGTTLPPSPNPDNATLAPVLAEAFKAYEFNEDYDVRGVRVTAKDWEPVRNSYTGVLISRRIAAIVVYHDRHESDPKLCDLEDVFFVRDVSGGAVTYAGRITGGPSSGGSTSIPCELAPQ